MWMLLLSFVLLASGLGVGQGQEINTDEFPYHERMDDNYDLYWNFNSTHIVFKLKVKTKGYIGFGISANGNMFPGDVIIGWLANGERHFADRHATGYFTPPIDASQDWFLLDASETVNTTTLTIIRELDTCDADDMPIPTGTARVIYSYHPDKPASDESIQYHGPLTRGTKSVILLQPPTASADPSPLPSDVITHDFLNQNYSVPARDTYYSCTTFKFELPEKHHMIRVEPVIQKGHESLVHHILIYYCPAPLPESDLNIEYECYDPDAIPDSVRNCFHVLLGWAIGGRGFDYPSHIGHSLGAEGDPVYFRMETHYDNPALRADFVDNSGLRLFLTKEIRQFDAGTLMAGHGVSAFQIIPPHYSNFMSRGHCHEMCLAEALGDQEIHVVGNTLHSHLLGRKLRARLVRNGVELPFIHADENYDFNFQEYVPLSEERTIKRGDSIIVDCEYDSSGNTEVTYGGLGTRNEMCLTFLLYYPRTPLTSCWSRPVYPAVEAAGSEAFFQNITDTDWTNQQVRTDFQETLPTLDILNGCFGDFADTNYEFHLTETPPVNVTTTYSPPDPCQQG